MDGERRRRYLEAMGVPVWVLRRESGTAHPVAAPQPVYPAAGPGMPDPEGSWDALRGEVHDCDACGLSVTRTQTVFGVGNLQADWLIVGEAPGAEEDRLGEPFVGRAGRLLDSMLAALGLDRRTVYIANIVKCRPPNNRDPAPDEMTKCTPFLERQIALIRPRIILAVGRIAAQQLLNTNQAVGRLRGRVHRWGDDHVPLVVTYHPAYLLRSPLEKRKAWQDLCLAREAVGSSE